MTEPHAPIGEPGVAGSAPRARFIQLPPPETSGGMPLLQALHQRQSWRIFAPTTFAPQLLSDLLWAAAGVNRRQGGGRMQRVPAHRREMYAAAAAGAMAQNVYLFCASAGLATAIRSWIDPGLLASAMQLGPEQRIVLSQGVGYACDSSA